MSADGDALPDAYFDAMYARAGDPWGFRSRWYERRKYALVLAALPRQRYRHALEPGCSVGELTRLLADRCDRVTATDVAPAARRSARAATSGLPGVEVVDWALGVDPWPVPQVDLVVLSDVAYYLPPARFSEVVRELRTHLAPGGTLLAAHWRPVVPEYPSDGDTVHSTLRSQSWLQPAGTWRDDDLLVDVLVHADAPGPSVAQREGLR